MRTVAETAIPEAPLSLCPTPTVVARGSHADALPANVPGVPTNPVESALILVLPPGNYTAIVSSASGTGIALLEVSDLRNLNGFVTAEAETLSDR